jgi:hypothetical protein
MTLALFTTTSYPISSLIADLDQGKIGLPDLQRPFVWPNVNVRNLFDSLFRGYPAGFLLFWNTGAHAGLKAIGGNSKQHAPALAIVDGQQRLTSLYAAIKAVEVVRANFKRERICIAFHPLSERFEVADAAVIKDKSFIPDISTLWQPDFKPGAFRKEFLAQLATVRSLTDDEIDRIENAIDHLRNLINYQFVVLTLDQAVNAETIAEVFVRINGEGKKLNQADFIMTLLSVFWDEGRAELEAFAREAARPSDNRQASPFNYFIRPSPDQLLRVTIGLGLKRARLESVYNVLRGRDAVTGVPSEERRQEQFGLLQAAQKHGLDLVNWHHFLGALTIAGYRSDKMISSQMAVIYSYVIYLIGACVYKISKPKIRQATAEFFFMAALTGRYTTSPETRFEADLAIIREIQDGEAFLLALREIARTVLTNDYWGTTLPAALATSAARSPSLFAYQAALIKLDARALYSVANIASMTDPAVIGVKAALEQHHLFPRAYLSTIGISDTRQINQIANFARVEWPDNLQIGSKPPAEYVPPLDSALSAEERDRQYGWHGLPHLWWELDYGTFLEERRVRMARVIRRAWEELTVTAGAAASAIAKLDVASLIAGGETDAVEYKSTLRRNLHTGQIDEKMHLAVLKTVAGFLNCSGGTLLIGVADDGEVLGLEADDFPNEDKLQLHLVNLITDRIGSLYLPYIHPHFEENDGKRILVIRCERGPKAAFVKDGGVQRLFVRGGNATTELTGHGILDFVQNRFS